MLAWKVRTIGEQGRRHIVIFLQVADIRVERAAQRVGRAHLHMGMSADGQAREETISEKGRWGDLHHRDDLSRGQRW